MIGMYDRTAQHLDNNLQGRSRDSFTLEKYTYNVYCAWLGCCCCCGSGGGGSSSSSSSSCSNRSSSTLLLKFELFGLFAVVYFMSVFCVSCSSYLFSLQVRHGT